MKTSSSPRLLRFLILFGILLAPLVARADSATWALNPATGDWNTATNWMPNTVPNGPGDVATFGTSSQMDIDLSSSVEVGAITFSAGCQPVQHHGTGGSSSYH